jgi:hypothetical protein
MGQPLLKTHQSRVFVRGGEGFVEPIEIGIGGQKIFWFSALSEK